jgi:hypothetical protein
MDKAFENELKSFIGLTEVTNIDHYKQKANQLAIMALTLQKFVTLTLDEVDYAGFKGAEMLAKIEMFLRAVTPSYPTKSFQDILTTLEEIDPRFPQTRFYYGLNVLRSLCTGQGKEFLEIIQGKEAAAHTLQEMVFFTTFLIENIIKYIQYFRSAKLTSNISNQEFKDNLEKRFEELVLRTVMSVSTTAQN